VALCAFATPAFAGHISLAWDPSTSGAVGYVVLYGFAPGFYTGALNVGNQTSATIRGLANGQIYYFAIQAYSVDGGISVLSNEVSASTTNTPPQVVAPATQTSSEGAAITIPVVASDAESDPLSFYATGLPGGLYIDSVTGVISGTIAFGAAGTYSVAITVGDGATVTTVNFTWNVHHTDQAPVVTGLPNQSSPVGATVSAQVVASDPDGDTLVYSATGLPPELAINPSTGLITGVLTSAGLYSVTAKASDGVTSTPISFSWTVLASNTPPTLSPPGDQAGSVVRSVSLQLSAFDADGNTLTFSSSGLPPGLSLNRSSGLITGRPTTAGLYGVTVSVSDGLNVIVQSFNWTIAPDMPPVVANPGPQFSAEGQNVSLQFVANDPEGVQLAFIPVLPFGLSISDQGLITGVPPAGTAAVFNASISASDGVLQTGVSFPWTILPSPAGPSFVQESYTTTSSLQHDVVVAYGAAQTAGNTNVVVVGWKDPTRNIVSVADSKGNVYTRAVGPTARSGYATQSIYYATNISAANARENVVSVAFDGDTPVVDIRLAEYAHIDPVNPIDVTAAAQGLSALSDSGGLATTHTDVIVAASFAETTATAAGGSFTARVITDPNGDALIDQVGMAGSYDATAPLLSSGQWIMQAVAFRLLAPAVTAATPSGAPVGGSVTLSGAHFGATQGTSSVTFNGIQATSTSWSDTNLTVQVPPGATSGNIIVTVQALPGNAVPFTVLRPPTLAPIANQSNAENDTIVSVSANGSDPNGYALTYTATNLPAGLTINSSTGAITGTLTYSSAGTYNVTVSVNDGVFPLVSQSFTWTVTNVNRPPVITPLGNIATLTSAVVSLPVIAVDPDGDPVTYSATGLPAGVSIDPNSGLLSGAPNAANVYNVTITATDGLAPATRSFVWTITSVTSGRVTFMQARSSTVFSNLPAVSVSYAASQTAASLDVVVVNWSDATVPISSVTDTGGKVYQLAIGPSTSPSIGSQSIYYAANVTAAAPGANVVTVAFAAAVAKAEVRIAEYQGIEPANVVDVFAGAQGTGAQADSGTVTTTFRNDLLFGAVWSSWATATSPEGGLTARLTTPSGTLLEDTTVSTAGPYDVRASIQPPNPWIIQLVAFRDVNHAPVLSNPGNQLSAANATVSLPLAAADSDNDPLTFTATGLPPGLSINAVSGVISGTLPWPSAGIYNVTATVSDGFLSNSQAFLWTVTGPTVSANLASFNPGSAVTVSWNAIPAPTSTDWIGLFVTGSPDTTPVTWWWTSGAASGSSVVTFPTTLPFGTYELRLFSHSSLQKLAVSRVLTVAGVTVSAGPAAVGPGATVMAAWSGVGSPTATDFLVLANTASPDNSYITWMYTNGQGTGQAGIVVPMSVVSGTYEVRLFSNNSFQRLGVSAPITIQTTSLVASPTTVPPGSTVTATWASIGTPTPNDWVVLVKTGSPDSAYVAWGYTNGASNGSRNLTMPKTAAPGTYEFRLFANNSTQRLAVSNPITVPDVALTASPSTLAPGGTLTLAWQYLGNPTSTDWLALVPTGAADTNWVAWIYSTGRGSDSTLFNIPVNLSAGSYEVRLFANNTFKRLAVSNTVTVTASGPTLATSPVSTSAGGTLTVSWRNIAAPTSTDWVGLYTVGAADANYVTKTYTNGRATDTVLITLPNNISTGSYELRLFSNDSLTLLASSNGFQVTANAVLSASPAIVSPGRTVNLTWAGIATPAATDWIGLVPLNGADNSYVAWRYTTGAANGGVGLVIPATAPAGTYEPRLFAQNSFQRLAVGNLIKVGATLSASPTVAAPGGTLTVAWAGIANPTAHDWLALVPLNAADNQWAAWEYTDSTATGSRTFNIPANLPAGSYDVRLFTNDTMTRIAVSTNVIKIASGPSLSVRNAALTATYHAGDTIQTVWSGIAAPSASDWIGVYPAGVADGAYVYQTTTTGQATGSKSIVLPSGLAAGQYELRLFSNGTMTRLTVSNSFAIQ
jgi:hypothetical protein